MSFRKILACLMLGAAVFVSLPELNINVAEAYTVRQDKDNPYCDILYDPGYGWGIMVDKSSVLVVGKNRLQVTIRSHGMRPIWSEWYKVEAWWGQSRGVRECDSGRVDTDSPLYMGLVQYLSERY